MKEGNDESGVYTHSLSVPYIWFPALHWPRPWTSWAVRWRVFGAQLRPGGRKAKRRRPLPRTGIIEQPSQARTWASPEPRAATRACGGTSGALCALQLQGAGEDIWTVWPRPALAGTDSISFGSPLGRGRGETGDLGARGGLLSARLCGLVDCPCLVGVSGLNGDHIGDAARRGLHGQGWVVWKGGHMCRLGLWAQGHFGHALLLVAVLASFLPSLPSRWTRSLSQGAISHKSSQSPDDSH